MPALDAAEHHVSPAENICRFGEDELVDDDVPPMLSPQAQNSENLSSSNMQPVNTLKPLTPFLTTNVDSFKTNETSYHSTVSEGLQNTSSSSASSDMAHHNISSEQISGDINEINKKNGTNGDDTNQNELDNNVSY